MSSENLPVVQRNQPVKQPNDNRGEIIVESETQHRESALSSFAGKLVRIAVRSALDWVSEHRSVQRSEPVSKSSMQSFKRNPVQQSFSSESFRSRCRQSAARRARHLRRRRWQS